MAKPAKDLVDMDLPSAIALLLAAACAAVSVLGLMGAFSDSLDVLNHFTPITLVLSLAALGANVGAEAHWPGLVLGGTAVCACLALMIPEVVAGRLPKRSDEAGARLKIVQFNLWRWSADPQASLAWILSEDADIVVLQETIGPWEAVSEALAGLYPHRSPPYWWASGATILSKIAPTGSGLLASTAAGRRSPAAWASFGDRRTGFSVAGTHLKWPIPAGPQQAQMERLAGELERFDAGSLILSGDFNSAPWSFTLRRLDRRLGLTRRTRALATWPARRFALPFPFLAIDHVYAGSDWKTVSVRRGPRLGSDHFPVVVILERTAGDEALFP
jgi:endonuclease/exonuclease/phosphatase (EEP) superfamily protein YafD